MVTKKTITATGSQLICCLNVYYKQGLQEKAYKADNTALERMRLLSK